MANRIDIYQREKPPKDRSKRKPLTAGKIWQVVVGLFLIFTGLAAFLWLTGANFDSEYRRAALFSIPDPSGGEARGTRLSACGIARTFLPESIDRAIPCVWWNLGAFFVIPAIAFVYAVKTSLSRD
ncbi:MAG: hypothetical protein AB7S71_04515 [Dongiaceae bacterium]